MDARVTPQSYSPSAGALCPPRSWLTDEPTISLNGSWDFVHHPRLPDPFDDPEKPSPCPVLGPCAERIDVPSHWVMAPHGRWGSPAYTNVDFPFPVDPPHPPADNPTGDYRRAFDVPAQWVGDGQIRLRFDGVESQARVWVNGTWIGMFTGSRLAHELDITGAVRPGANEVVVRVSQFSSGSYLEDQDQWWLPGIFRDVELRHLGAASVHDVWLSTDYRDGEGRVRVEVLAPGGGGGALDGVLRLVGAEGEGAVLPVRLGPGPGGRHRSGWVDCGPVRPWSPDQPVLYRAELALDGAAPRGLRIGFTRVEVVGGQLRANGAPLVFNGVNRHEIRHDRGRVFDEAWVREDLALMKSLGVNAIRTSHYPPHPRVLDLADEIGLWVVLEGDIETHGFEGADRAWADNPSDDPRWADAFDERTRRAFERDKNHPSIVLWSLGNESGTGANLAAAARWIHERAEGALVHYEGDHAMEYADVYSRMYPALEEVAAALDDSDPRAPIAVPGHPSAEVDGEARARARRAPYLMCEYLHAMGTGPGGAALYAAQMDHPRHAGGFVWEWRDHALDQRHGGALRLAYGGDFGEPIHDGTFVCDGLVDAHSRIYAGTWAWARAMAPGAPALRALAAKRARVEERDADGARALRGLAQWCAAHGENGAEAPEGALHAVDVDATGAWTALGGLPVRASVSLYRAPTDNDRGRGPLDYWGLDEEGVGPMGEGLNRPGVSRADRWEEARLAFVRRSPRSLLERSDGARLVHERWGAASRQFGVDARSESRPLRIGLAGPWGPFLDGERVVIDLEPYGPLPRRLPRMGLRLELPGGPWEASWVGEASIAYADMPGDDPDGYGAGATDALWDVCVRPQEGGHRPGLKALRLGRGSDALYFVPLGALGWSVCPWDERELAEAAHWGDLAESDRTFLWLDAVQDGIGSRSCGPDSRPRFAAAPAPRRIAFVCARAHKAGADGSCVTVG